MGHPENWPSLSCGQPRGWRLVPCHHTRSHILGLESHVVSTCQRRPLLKVREGKVWMDILARATEVVVFRRKEAQVWLTF